MIRFQYGTIGDDVMFGTRNDDVIRAGAGDDTILDTRARPSNDAFFGGRGEDVIVSSRGDDRLYGGAGDDTLVIRPSHSLPDDLGNVVGYERQVFGGAGHDEFVLRNSAGYEIVDQGDHVDITDRFGGVTSVYGVEEFTYL
jgi:Ca2+-binding RTX toxin-like protein